MQHKVEAVLHSLGMNCTHLSVEGCTLQCAVSRSTSTLADRVDLAPPEHTLVLTWSRIAEDADTLTAMVDNEANMESPHPQAEEGNLCIVAVLLDPVTLLST